MPGPRRSRRAAPSPGLAALLCLAAACASARELTIVVEPDEGVDPAKVEVEVSRRATRKVPFVSCDPDYNLLGGYFQCEPKPDRTERLTARRDGPFLRFGPIPERRFGLSGLRVQGITVRVPAAVIEIAEERDPRDDGAPPEDSAHVYYDSAERRALFGAPREPPPGPLHPVQAWLDAGWPREVVVRPERLRFEDRKLIGAIWRGLSERGDAGGGGSWAGWRLRRAGDGAGRLEHAPTGAVVSSGAGRGPGTIALPRGRAVALPLAPPPRDDRGDPAREETLEVITVPASEAPRLVRYWQLRGEYGDGALGENAFALPIERWRELAGREDRAPGLADLALEQGEACGAPSLDGEPLVCVRLERTGALPETLLLAAAYRETDTRVSALAYRLVELP